MDLHGIHGVAHWQRVREKGVRIAKQTGANPLIVELFAFLHDCCREDDGTDSGHGERAAEFGLSLRKSILHLSDADFRVGIRPDPRYLCTEFARKKETIAWALKRSGF
jgi:uncharacterized protein